jgi:hypothetical protein
MENNGTWDNINGYKRHHPQKKTMMVGQTWKAVKHRNLRYTADYKRVPSPP